MLLVFNFEVLFVVDVIVWKVIECVFEVRYVLVVDMLFDVENYLLLFCLVNCVVLCFVCVFVELVEVLVLLVLLLSVVVISRVVLVWWLRITSLEMKLSVCVGMLNLVVGVCGRCLSWCMVF